MTRPRGLRPRIRPTDAALVRSRVEAAADALGLRCGLLTVLAAVLALTVGYKKLRDDPAIRHVAARFPVGARNLSPDTIGRLLAKLAALEFIVYEPARGRGRTAHLAIHPRFCEGVTELARDRYGKVIINADEGPRSDQQSSLENPPNTGPHRGCESGAARPIRDENVEFSGPALPLTGFSKKNLTSPLQASTDSADDHRTTRPTEVSVNPKDVAAVMGDLPAVYDRLPRHLTWLLRVQVRQQLARGYTPGQILKVLAAPLPDNVTKPYILAVYRFKKNSIGAGPRLGQVQREWDRRQLAAEQQAAVETTHRWLTKVTNATDPAFREDLLVAYQTRYPSAQLVHRAAMLAQVGRCATRAFPELSLAAALRRWCAQNLPDRHQRPAAHNAANTTLLEDLLSNARHDNTCVSCQSRPGSVRPQLPDPLPVCDSCWTSNTDPELLEAIPA